jgi:hypothetical protein
VSAEKRIHKQGSASLIVRRNVPVHLRHHRGIRVSEQMRDFE